MLGAGGDVRYVIELITIVMIIFDMYVQLRGITVAGMVMFAISKACILIDNYIQ